MLSIFCRPVFVSLFGDTNYELDYVIATVPEGDTASESSGVTAAQSSQAPSTRSDSTVVARSNTARHEKDWESIRPTEKLTLKNRSTRQNKSNTRCVRLLPNQKKRRLSGHNMVTLMCL